MALDPLYKTKCTAEAVKLADKVLDVATAAARSLATKTADAALKVAVLDVRAAQPGYPVDLTHCTIGGTRYEIDHVDGTGKPRTPDDVAAIMKQLIAGHLAPPAGAVETVAAPAALDLGVMTFDAESKLP